MFVISSIYISLDFAKNMNKKILKDTDKLPFSEKRFANHRLFSFVGDSFKWTPKTGRTTITPVLFARSTHATFISFVWPRCESYLPGVSDVALPAWIKPSCEIIYVTQSCITFTQRLLASQCMEKRLTICHLLLPRSPISVVHSK